MGCLCSHHQHQHTPIELNNIKLSTLQEEIGRSPVLSISDFENWGKTQASRKVLKVTPTTVEEVQKIVITAANHNLKVSTTSFGMPIIIV